jgi:mannose-6-phosphate isomerase-like protein (cupin superfamily)
MRNIVKKEERQKIQNSKDCFIFEYPFNDKDIELSCAEIRGRYPLEGFAMNEKIKEIFYINKGKGKINIEGKDLELKEGDVILIQAKQKYFWQGDLDLVLACNPKFNPEQHKNIK